MEIFVRKHEQTDKLTWLSSLPGKYKEEILEKLIEDNVDLNKSHQYKVVVDICQSKEILENIEKNINGEQYINYKSYIKGQFIQQCEPLRIGLHTPIINNKEQQELIGDLNLKKAEIQRQSKLQEERKIQKQKILMKQSSLRQDSTAKRKKNDKATKAEFGNIRYQEDNFTDANNQLLLEDDSPKKNKFSQSFFILKEQSNIINQYSPLVNQYISQNTNKNQFNSTIIKEEDSVVLVNNYPSEQQQLEPQYQMGQNLHKYDISGNIDIQSSIVELKIPQIKKDDSQSYTDQMRIQNYTQQQFDQKQANAQNAKIAKTNPGTSRGERNQNKFRNLNISQNFQKQNPQINGQQSIQV
eukprot:403355879